MEIQILKQGLLPVTEIEEYLFSQLNLNQTDEKDSTIPPPLAPSYEYMSYTLIKVVKNILGKHNTDTLVFFNGSGSMCSGSLSNLEIGTNYILKVYETRKQDIKPDLKKYLRDRGLFIQDWENKKIYTNHICHVWLLTLKDEVVKGNIKQNKREQLMKEFNQSFDKLSEEERKNRIKVIKETKPEEMTYTEFVKFINK